VPCLTDAKTLRTVDDLFRDLGFSFGLTSSNARTSALSASGVLELPGT